MKIVSVRFNGKNYRAWAYVCGLVLDEAGVGYTVQEDSNARLSSSANAPSSNEINMGLSLSANAPSSNEINTGLSSSANAPSSSEREKIRKDQAKAVRIIASSVDDDILGTIIGEKSPFTVWTMLKSQYESTSMEMQLHLQGRLNSLKMKDGEDFNVFYGGVRQMRQQLSDTGCTVNDAQLVAYLLQAMPKSYEAVKQFIMNSGALKLPEVVAKLGARSEVLKLEKMRDGHEEDEGEAAAFAGAGGRGRGRGGYYRGGRGRGGRGSGDGERRCYSCDQPGHLSYDCPRNQQRCKYCHHPRPNHPEEKCFFKPGGAGSGGASYQASEDGSKKGGSAFTARECAMSSADGDHVDFILDSGATKPFITDEALMCEVRQTAPKKIYVANNESVELNRIGKVKMNMDGHEVSFGSALSAPGFSSNLLSVSCITANGGQVLFVQDRAFVVKDLELSVVNNEVVIAKPARIVFSVPRKQDLYVLSKKKSDIMAAGEASMPAVEATAPKDQEQVLWHQRLAHVSVNGLHELVTKGAVRDLPASPMAKVRDPGLDYSCEPCALGKAHRQPFSSVMHEDAAAARIMGRWHMDVKGPIYTKKNGVKRVVTSLGGSKYLLGITDEFSSKAWIVPMKTKDEATEHFIALHKEMERATGQKLLEIHTDGGGEFVNSAMTAYCTQLGIKHTVTCRGTPQHNGRAERLFRTVCDKARTMLIHARKSVSAEFFIEAVMQAVVINNMTVLRDGKTAEEIWSGVKPTVKNLRVFGCDAIVHLQAAQRALETDPKAIKCIHLGFSDDRKGWRLFNPQAKNKRQPIIFSRDVQFNENGFSARRLDDDHHPQDSAHADHGIIEIDIVGEQEDAIEDASQGGEATAPAPEPAPVVVLQPAVAASENANGQVGQRLDLEPSESVPAVRPRNAYAGYKPPVEREAEELQRGVTRSGRARHVDRASHDAENESMDYAEEVAMSAVIRTGVQQVMDDDSPTYEQAMAGPERHLWTAAMQEELHAMKTKGVFEYVDVASLGPETNVTGCKWVLKKKYNSDGQVAKRKARLVCKGFTQMEGVDYHETFAPTLRMKSLRIMLTIAAVFDYEMKHLDVPTAFLNAKLKEAVYMAQPPGQQIGGANTVIKLLMAIYGTKQASHEWNDELSQFVVEVLGFSRCKSDTCIFVKKSRSGRAIILGVFVDDLLPVFHAEDSQEWNEYQSRLVERYGVKDMGDAAWTLGMEIQRDRARRCILLTHKLYQKNMLHRYGMDESAPNKTPAEMEKLSLKDCAATIEEESEVDRSEYMAMVGSLMYLAVTTRPDIGFAVSQLARYMQSPGKRHVVAAKRVMRYICGTPNHGLRFDGASSENGQKTMMIQAQCDADWGGELDERKSRSGYLIHVNGCLVSYSSKLQKTVSLSSAEAEYFAISVALQEIIWIRQVLTEVLMGTVPVATPVLQCDNRAAIAISSNDIHHERTKHIDIRHHFIREEVKQKRLILEWIGTKDQAADIMTKPLGTQLFEKFRDAIVFNWYRHRSSTKEEC
jgi:transposase InsO family protein